MKVLYDYQAFCTQTTGGVSRYFVELMRAGVSCPTLQATLLAPLSINQHLNAAREELSPIRRGIHLALRGKPNPLLSLLNRMGFSLMIAGRSWDIYHPTYYHRVWTQPRARFKVVTVFDMLHERFPASFSKLDPTSARKRKLVSEADGIICISHSTQRDLTEILGVKASHCTVIPLATRIQEIHSLPLLHSRPYWLYVGNRGGYKDFEVLVDALTQVPGLAETDVICFGAGEFTPGEQQALKSRRLTARVRTVSGPDALLRGAYEQAIALIYPSRYEGFGLPPLEAMTLGCPVIVANGSSLPEVVAQAGAMFPPGDSSALASLMERVHADTLYRQNLIQTGIDQARQFSWKKTAEQTFDFYSRLIS